MARTPNSADVNPVTATAMKTKICTVMFIFLFLLQRNLRRLHKRKLSFLPEGAAPKPRREEGLSEATCEVSDSVVTTEHLCETETETD